MSDSAIGPSRLFGDPSFAAASGSRERGDVGALEVGLERGGVEHAALVVDERHGARLDAEPLVRLEHELVRGPLRKLKRSGAGSMKSRTVATVSAKLNTSSVRPTPFRPGSRRNWYGLRGQPRNSMQLATKVSVPPVKSAS